MNFTVTDVRENTSLGHVGHVLYLDPPEHVFPSHVATHMQSISWAAMTMILTTNGYLIYFIISKELTTFLDWLVIFDSSLCITNGFTYFTRYILGVSVIKKFGTCYFLVFFAFFINISNRLLTIAIVAYRYVFVLKNWLVATPAQRRVFSSLILLFILLPSLLLTGVAVHYRDYWLRFLSRTSTTQARPSFANCTVQAALAANTSSTSRRIASTWRGRPAARSGSSLSPTPSTPPPSSASAPACSSCPPATGPSTGAVCITDSTSTKESKVVN